MRSFKQIIGVVAFLCLSQSGIAATFSGIVETSSQAPVAGAMVTAFNHDGARKITVYSDEKGQYLLDTPFSGEVKVRVRTPFYDDVTREFTAASDQRVQYNSQLTQLKSKQSHSDTLTASAHAAALEWSDNPEVEDAFVSQCNYCHQVGNSLTRVPRERDDWRETIRRMEGYMATVTDHEADVIADTLYKGFDGKPIESIQTYEYHSGLEAAKVEEWLVGDGLSFIHDADVASNGMMYGSDEGHDKIFELNPETGEIAEYPLPDIDLPVGGKFSGIKLPIGVFTGKHGPHSFAEDKSGKLWITNSLSSILMSFDTETKEFKSYDFGDDALYLHTVRIDKEGIIWFTNGASNNIGRFDPKTEEKTLIDTPSNGWARWLAVTLMPTMLKLTAAFPDWAIYPDMSHHKTLSLGRSTLSMLYGIDVNPVDGTIWYVKLEAHKLGMVDPETLEVTEIDTPLRGPRRPRFDRNGILWIPAFEDSALMRFDPQTREFKIYDMPTLGDKEIETPYALNVHPETNDVWITSNTSDRIFRFDQKTETFSAYPSPTRVTYLRDLVFSKDGKVCSSQSNLPAYAIEGGRPSFICLDPNGVKKDIEALAAAE